jgi:hypothetical protein
VTTACVEALKFVDVPGNQLTGGCPTCMRGNSSARKVLVAGNCFADARHAVGQLVGNTSDGEYGKKTTPLAAGTVGNWHQNPLRIE